MEKHLEGRWYIGWEIMRVFISQSSMIKLYFRMIEERVDKGCEKWQETMEGVMAGAQGELTRAWQKQWTREDRWKAVQEIESMDGHGRWALGTLEGLYQ